MFCSTARVRNIFNKIIFYKLHFIVYGKAGQSRLGLLLSSLIISRELLEMILDLPNISVVVSVGWFDHDNVDGSYDDVVGFS